METDTLPHATAAQVDDFLQLYGNDAEAAVTAIRARAQLQISERAPSRAPNPAVPTGKIIIAASEVTKEYKLHRQKIPAVNGVSLEIHEGEFVALVGPSGSGKSTLLQLLGGLEKPTHGTIRVNGMDLNSMSDRKLSRFRGQTIGFVFQFFYLQPFLRLERNLVVPGMFAHTDRQARRARARQLAATVGIADRLDHFPKELSGGQIQRAAIVRALMNNPKVILADEPTGNLDSKNGAGIIDLFERIRRDFGTTIVVATHDAGIAARADRILNIKDGKIV